MAVKWLVGAMRDYQKLAWILVLAFVPLGGCVSTPEGRKFNPIEGARRIDDNIGASIDRLQSSVHNDSI